MDRMNLVGKMLGQYHILAHINSGGMGDVYKAAHSMLGREVAIKVLSPTFARDAHFVKRFLKEAKALAQLKHHPHIVAVHDAGNDNDKLYIVMEYLEGGSLEDMIKREGALAPQRVVQLLGQVAEGLDHIHRHNLIHRDIKPSNILFDAQGEAKITDFGVVKNFNVSLITVTGQILGTPAYMAPEQIQGQVVSPQTDIYGLSIVGYEMLTGQVPFQGTMSNIFDGHLRLPPPPPSQLNRRWPLAVDAVVLKALAKNPSQRYQSATAFVHALEQALRPPRPDSPPRPKPSWWDKFGSPFIWAGLGAVALLICIVGTMAFIAVYQPPSPIPPAKTVVPTITATSKPTATAIVTTTPEPKSTYEANRTLVYGPEKGSLVHNNDEFIEVRVANVQLHDFWVEATFFNPYATSTGTWDYGFLFRDEGGNEQFRLVIQSDKTWYLRNQEGDDSTLIDSKEVPELDISPNGSNHLLLIADQNLGYLYLNNQFVAGLDLSARTNVGDISVATGMFEGDEVAGQPTLYQDFTIWSIP